MHMLAKPSEHSHSHSHSNEDDASKRSAEGIRVVQVSVVVLIITAVVQLVIVWFSGSSALLADTVHNFSDALSAVPLGIAFVLGRRPANRRYPFGYARYEDLAGLLIVGLILLSAVLAAWQSISHLRHLEPMEHVPWVAAAGLVGFAGNESVALYRIRAGRRINSPALIADGQHARADGLTSLAVVASSVASWFKIPMADPILGLLIATMITVILISATRDVLRRLLDSIDPEYESQIAIALATHGDQEILPAVRVRQLGYSLLAEADLELPGETTLETAMGLVKQMEADAKAAVPRLQSLRIQFAPREESYAYSPSS